MVLSRIKETCLLLWLFIILVSAIDGYLVFRHRNLIGGFEQNPVGRALIALNDGGVWYLLIAKCCGTIVVAGTLLTLLHYRARLGIILIVVIASLQLCLLLSLMLR